MTMFIREALLSDIPRLSLIRNSVKENVLSKPDLVTHKDYEAYLCRRGKGWVCELNDSIAGFAIADLQDHNIWALFVMPAFERKGVGRMQHDCMLHWYFKQTKQTVWLGTAPDTRAAAFYRKAGWTETGLRKNGELKFEMTIEDWALIKSKK